MAEPFSVFAAKILFTDWNGQESIRANWKDFFFQDVKIYTPEYSQVFILQKLGFRLYIIFTYFFYTFTLDDYMWST